MEEEHEQVPRREGHARQRRRRRRVLQHRGDGVAVAALRQLTEGRELDAALVAHDVARRGVAAREGGRVADDAERGARAGHERRVAGCVLPKTRTKKKTRRRGRRAPSPLLPLPLSLSQRLATVTPATRAMRARELVRHHPRVAGVRAHRAKGDVGGEGRGEDVLEGEPGLPEERRARPHHLGRAPPAVPCRRAPPPRAPGATRRRTPCRRAGAPARGSRRARRLASGTCRMRRPPRARRRARSGGGREHQGGPQQLAHHERAAVVHAHAGAEQPRARLARHACALATPFGSPRSRVEAVVGGRGPFTEGGARPPAHTPSPHTRARHALRARPARDHRPRSCALPTCGGSRTTTPPIGGTTPASSGRSARAPAAAVDAPPSAGGGEAPAHVLDGSRRARAAARRAPPSARRPSTRTASRPTLPRPT